MDTLGHNSNAVEKQEKVIHKSGVWCRKLIKNNHLGLGSEDVFAPLSSKGNVAVGVVCLPLAKLWVQELEDCTA